jgi:hypothetical protein
MAARDLEEFRRTFRTGEQVAGRVLSRPDALHAWVDISGFELLAATDTNPPAGSTLSFFIARMHPTVVLREVARRDGAGDGPDPRRIGAALSGFAGARAALESRLAALGPAEMPPTGGPPVDLASLKRRFLARLRRDPQAWEAFSRTARLARELSSLSRAGRFLYAPWYPPRATGHELVLGVPGPDGTREIQLSFRLAEPGEVRIKALHRGGEARYMVFAARPEALPGHGFAPEAVRLGRRLVRLAPLGAPRPLADAAPSLAASLFGGGAGSFTGVNLRV